MLTLTPSLSSVQPLPVNIGISELSPQKESSNPVTLRDVPIILATCSFSWEQICSIRVV